MSCFPHSRYGTFVIDTSHVASVILFPWKAMAQHKLLLTSKTYDRQKTDLSCDFIKNLLFFKEGKRAVVDAGMKAVSMDSGVPLVCFFYPLNIKDRKKIKDSDYYGHFTVAWHGMPC